MNKQDIGMMIRVAKEYYELKMDQEQIAKKENISKSTVSRLTRKAAELGYVKIEVDFPMESVIQIEEKIKSLFSVKHVFICHAYIDDYLVRINDTCKVVAQDISKMVQDNEIIGVSWGRTMDSVASHLIPPNPPKRNIKIVQMHGALTKNIASSKFNSIVEKYSDAFLGTDYLLPAPVFVDTKEIADALMKDSNIRMIFDIIKKSDLAVFGIGEVSATSKLIERGIYTEEQYNVTEHDGVVGDICSRYYDINGNPALPDLMDRTIAIRTEDLKKKKHRIGVGVGEHKTRAIIGALNSGIMTALYTDEITARDVLRQYETLNL